MPELPEVEISAQIAARALKGKYISKVSLVPCKLFRLPKLEVSLRPIDQSWVSDSQDLVHLLHGAKAVAPYTLRYGKLMACLFQTQDGRGFCLFARLGMTGKFISSLTQAAQRPGLKLSVELSPRRETTGVGSRLDFINTRMFGSVWAQASKEIVESKQMLERLKEIFQTEVTRSGMGPDAYELSQDAEAWVKHLRSKANHRRSKSALLDQSCLAGVGNIYAAEGLFVAGLHPQLSFSNASDEQLQQMAQGIYQAMQETLNLSLGQDEVIYGLGHGKESPFAVYGRDGLPCIRCRKELSLIRVAGRSTVFCSRCQPSLPTK
jgi:DNA-formamidopyrimidine glycosylase